MSYEESIDEREREDINISGNFAIYSSPCAYLGGHPLISSIVLLTHA